MVWTVDESGWIAHRGGILSGVLIPKIDCGYVGEKQGITGGRVHVNMGLVSEILSRTTDSKSDHYVINPRSQEDTNLTGWAFKTGMLTATKSSQ